MLNGTLEKLTLCKSRPAPCCRNEFDAMLYREPDPNAPICDSVGNPRSLYLYRPASGVIPCSAGIIVLRETGGEASAIRLLEETCWAERAERDHYVILLPEPAPGGWNLTGQPDAPDDDAFALQWLTTGTQQYLLGCKVHRTSVYLAGFGAAAGLAARIALQHGKFLAGLYLENAGAAPDSENEAEDPNLTVKSPVPAWLVNCCNPLETALGSAARKASFPFRCFARQSEHPLAALRGAAWDTLFLGLRRWPTGGDGTVTHKSTEAEMGLECHLDEPVPGSADRTPHTWYEYAPENPAGEKLPLLLALHGGGTSAKYCAEQNRWQELAEKYGFYVVYPQSSADAVWNANCDRNRPDDEAYLLGLCRYLQQKYPIDPTRIYCTGFSMGSLMTQTMGMLHSELFAAIAPFSGYRFASDWDSTGIHDEQPLQLMAKEGDWLAQADFEGRETRIPVIQFHGDIDPTWDDAAGVRTRAYWAQRNKTATPELSGMPCRKEGADARFSIWDQCSGDGACLYRFVSVAGLPHAVDLRQPYLAWEFLSGFFRSADGALHQAERPDACL